MGTNICKFQENRLIDRLCSLKVRGEVIKKKMMESTEDKSERGVVVVKFKNRMIEILFDTTQFERAEIGKQIWFSPPIPERDSCNCHLFIWLTAGVVAGVLAIGAITSHFQEKTAVFLSFAAVGWISIIAWVRTSSHAQSKYFRNLEMEIDFFKGTTTSCQEDPQ